MESSSDEEENSNNRSGLVIPETDEEKSSGSETEVDDPVPIVKSRRSMAAKLVATDESSDEEEKLRKSLYEAESDVEENQPAIEERAFSKTTRMSIGDFQQRSSTIPNSDSDDDEDDGSIILAATDDEDDNAKGNENPMGNPALSSTIRSPLKEMSDNLQSISIEESFEENSGLLDEAAGGETSTKQKVSRSMYEKIKTEKEQLEQQRSVLEGRKDLFKNLPDGGQKVRIKIEGLVSDIKKKEELINSMVIDENLSVKSEITRSFNQSNGGDSSSISFHDVTPAANLPNYVKVSDIKPVFMGKVGMQNFNQMMMSVSQALHDLMEQINDRPPDTEEVEQPKYLKVELMKHQRQALRFMMWRETWRPRGGILADGKKQNFQTFSNSGN
jgi:hypothetical protein